MMNSLNLFVVILALSFVGTVHAMTKDEVIEKECHSGHCDGPECCQYGTYDGPECKGGDRRLELVDSQDAKWSEHLDMCAFVDYQVFLLVEGYHGFIVATPQDTEGKNKECTPMVFDSKFGQGYAYATKRVASPVEEIEQKDMLYLGTKPFHEIEEAFQLASPGDGVYDVVARQTCADLILSFLKILNFPVDEHVVEYNAQRFAKEKFFVDLVRNHPETKKRSQMLSDLDLMRVLTKYYLSSEN